MLPAEHLARMLSLRATARPWRALILISLFLPLLAAATSTPGTLPADAVQAPDGSVVTPLIGEGPAWWTPEVRDKALAAGRLGLGYDFERDEMVDVAAATPSQVFIRPGTQIFPNSIFPGWCTAAFTFYWESSISTAGHCTLYAGDPVFALAAPTTVINFGSTWDRAGGWIGDDWALISIDWPWNTFADSDVALIGGPHGAGGWGFPLLKHVGHGTAVGTGGTPRAGLLTGDWGSYVTFEGVVQGGDSGSPLLEALPLQDRAVGIITHGTCLDFFCLVVGSPYYAMDVYNIPHYWYLDNGDDLPI